ncbi:C-type lectin domain family 1 member A-like [Oxyura jamaicensis]|uniref:C-type lectin domain family 1 member A-like n=1 Tax=Oxyura jamaicensis TaxID=8884 RepID=UPI0015A65B23|nr:C-type lectin domain family 1 member A-like [Oxyura jamaicensis]
MTDEIIYANLKFENCYEMDTVPEPEVPKEKGLPTSSHSWWPLVLILITICLALLMGLMTLAILFSQGSKDYRTQIRDLNITKNDLHANFSKMLQAIGSQLCLGGSKDLQNNDLNCVLCPTNWKWPGDGDMCYYHSTEQKTWQQSLWFCSSQNSTLLLVKDMAKLELVKKIPKKTFWIGLSFRADKKGWFWADNTTVTEEQKSWTNNLQLPLLCGYIYNHVIYSHVCEAVDYYVCEKPAIQLQRRNNHQQEEWFVRFFQVPKDSAEGKKLQEMREALCSEGKENNETKCALCPASWQSSGADSCFYISKQKKTWKESQEFCSSRNSTLLVLKDKAKMVSLPQDSQFYWVGLSYISERNGWYWEDGTALSREAKTWTVLYEHIFCASLYGRIIYASNSCLTKQFWICEKGAIHFA